MSLILHFLNSNPDFVLKKKKKTELSPMNMAESSIRIFPNLEKGTVENGVQICWMTTAGILQGRHQMAKVRGKRR
jgi:hypothetical protein